MKVKCLQCGTVSDPSEWKEISFYCEDCRDDHTGVECPNDECYSIEGPGISGYVEVHDGA